MQLQAGAQSVQGTLVTGWPQRRVLAHSVHEADSQPLAIDAVLSELATITAIRGARLDVELADAQIHFDVVTGDFAGSSERQLQAIATACVAELLGDAAPNQVVRWQLQPDLRHLLICAIEQQDIKLLEEAALRHGLALVTLQPEFCVQWNRHGSALPDESGIFGTLSGTHATVAHAMRGVITSVSSGHFSSPLDERVDRLLASVGLDTDKLCPCVMVVPDTSTLEMSSRWTVLNRHREAA